MIMLIKTKNIKTFDYSQQVKFRIDKVAPSTRNVGGASKDVLDLDVTLTDHQGVAIQPRVTLFIDYATMTPFAQFVTAFMEVHPECVDNDGDGTLDEQSFVGKTGVAKSWEKNGYIRLSDFRFDLPAPDFSQFNNGGAQ